MNYKKRQILHELGLKKAREDYKNKLYSQKIDFNELRSDIEAGDREEANKQNKKLQEVILDEWN
jgi:hypothetical protein